MKRLFIFFFIINSYCFAGNYSDVIEQAKKYLDNSISSDYVSNDSLLYSDFVRIRDYFNYSLLVKNRRCRGRFSSYVAYVIPSEKPRNLKIYICKKFKSLSKESLAQTLIHEVSHLVIGPDEHVATRYETLATYLGGRTPELNGYNSGQIIFDIIEDFTDKNFIDRNMDYFVLMNIRTKSKFRELLLRTYAVYGECTKFETVLTQLCTEDKSCKDNILSRKDDFGLSISDVNLNCRS